MPRLRVRLQAPFSSFSSAVFAATRSPGDCGASTRSIGPVDALHKKMAVLQVLLRSCCRAQLGDFGRGYTDFLQDGVGVLARRRHWVQARLTIVPGFWRQQRRHRAGCGIHLQPACRARSCGCCHSPTTSRSWALAIWACSSRKTTISGVSFEYLSTIDVRSSALWASGLALPVERGSSNAGCCRTQSACTGAGCGGGSSSPGRLAALQTMSWTLTSTGSAAPLQRTSCRTLTSASGPLRPGLLDTSAMVEVRSTRSPRQSGALSQRGYPVGSLRRAYWRQGAARTRATAAGKSGQGGLSGAKRRRM